MKYNFKTLSIIPKSNELIDIILSKTQRKTPTVIHPGYIIELIKLFIDMKYHVLEIFIKEKLNLHSQQYMKNYKQL